MLNLEAITNASVATEPFKFFMAAGVLSAVDLAAVRADFPDIRKPGIFPIEELSYGPVFARLIEDLRSREFEDVMEKKYGVELSGKPMMITVRGQAQKKDGRIHTDSKTKYVTGLLYLNDVWDESQGRLRMLRNASDVDNYVAEIPPDGGTMASFLRTDNSWHGHEPYEGERRYIMFNWMTSQAALTRELGRHSLSARVKRNVPFFYKGA